MRVRHVCAGRAREVQIGGRAVLTAIAKRAADGPVVVRALGLEGDEQADLSVHGGLDKAVYGYPSEHLAFWQTKRLEHSVSLWDEVLPSGLVGENLSLQGLLESQVWVGDELHFPGCVLRVTAPREPCYKFNAVMGYPQAARDMMLAGCCGFYLAVKQGGTIEAGQYGTLVPGQRGLSIAEAFQARRIKHLR